jgi:hypothetical protein
MRRVTIVLAGGLLAAVLALHAAPARAENPMTPLRPTEPSASIEPPSALRGTAPPGLPTDTGAAASEEAPEPRARRGSRQRAGSIKPGRWEFRTRLQTPASASSRPPAAARVVPAAAEGMLTTYTTCIEADNAVPADLGPQCRLERHERRGSRISWSMSCSNTGVRAEGVAQYRGDTMLATVVSRLPAAAGTFTEMTQHLTGRYLGRCLSATAAMPLPVASPAENRIDQRAAVPAAGADGATSTLARSAESPEQTASGPSVHQLEDSRQQVRQKRRGHRAHRRSRGRSAYRSYRGTSFLGPSPHSSGGP